MMMKKFLILMLVLGMTSMASAAISLSAPGVVAGEITMPSGDLVVTVVSDDDQPWDGFIAIIDGTYGDFGAVAMLPAAGSDATMQDYGPYSIYAHIAALGAASLDPDNYDVTPGSQFQTTVAFTGAALQQDLQILLLNDGLAEVGSIAIHGIPEPMTVALLGLGGLFMLRRRK
jgi:hypothetical protein